MFLVGSTVISPLGIGLFQNVDKIIANESGISQVSESAWGQLDLPLGMIKHLKPDNRNITRFDTLIKNTLDLFRQDVQIDLRSKSVGIILSTTKGNIEWVDSEFAYPESLLLSYSANKIAEHLQNPNKPYVVSQACISGLSAFMLAHYLFELKKYEHILLIGCDVLSKFVISGFKSLYAISNAPCRPFDMRRDGITLGEACGVALLSRSIDSDIIIHKANVTNDANHISGPSKTGEELKTAIEKAISNAAIEVDSIDFICAHGTATIYNDEMESKAVALSRLSSIPAFSLKSYFGHTLGASGVIETVLMAELMKRGIIAANINYSENGVENRMNINTLNQFMPLRYGLKTGAGFGGCNAALVVEHKAA